MSNHKNAGQEKPSSMESKCSDITLNMEMIGPFKQDSTSHPPQPFWVLGSSFLDVSHDNCWIFLVRCAPPYQNFNNFHLFCVERNEKSGGKDRRGSVEEEEAQVKGCLINLKRAQ